MLAGLRERVAPRHTALLIIDMQKDFCVDGMATAGTGRDLSRTKAIVQDLVRLRDAAREAGVLVVHIGVPRWAPSAPADNSRDAARRSVEALSAAAEPLGVRIAIEVIPNELSRPDSLVHFVENVLDTLEIFTDDCESVTGASRERAKAEQKPVVARLN